MAVILHPHLSSPWLSSPHLQLNPRRKTKGLIKSQQDSSPEEPISDSTTKLKGSQGLGFGSSTQKKGKRERASIIRREPVQKPELYSPPSESRSPEEFTQNESAFLLAWLGLGGVILLQGIALAASGFLPEEWDAFFVKYLYPSFTPTVFVFIAGTVGYGVLKYLQNEKSTKK